ncbi:MAG: hypothetical protein WCL49_10855 [bacterium]
MPNRPEERTLLSFEDEGLPEIMLVGRNDYRQAHPPLLPHAHPDVFEKRNSSLHILLFWEPLPEDPA